MVELVQRFGARGSHPGVQWRGVVPRHALPAIYNAADAFAIGGGVLDTDLRRAALAALGIARDRPRERALPFDRQGVAEPFAAHFVEADAGRHRRVTDRTKAS